MCRTHRKKEKKGGRVTEQEGLSGHRRGLQRVTCKLLASLSFLKNVKNFRTEGKSKLGDFQQQMGGPFIRLRIDPFTV